MSKVSIVTLGCAKNTADTDNLARVLKAKGHQVIADAAQADAIVVHTCSFIEAAKKESIERGRGDLWIQMPLRRLTSRVLRRPCVCRKAAAIPVRSASSHACGDPSKADPRRRSWKKHAAWRGSGLRNSASSPRILAIGA